jgi:hypothetical protein
MDIEKQIRNNDVNKKTALQSEHEEDMRKRNEAQAKYEEQCAVEAAKKKILMEQYKQQLDTQINLKRKAQLYGNMTHVEKRLNQDEIQAYKNRDTSYKPLIHGLSSSPVKQLFHKEHAPEDHKEQVYQLKTMGLTTDPTRGMNTGGHMDAHMSSLNQLGANQSP